MDPDLMVIDLCEEVWRQALHGKFNAALAGCDKIRELAPKLLDSSKASSSYTIHSVEGFIAAKKGDIQYAIAMLDKATRYLIQSPRNASFGPSLALPNLLLSLGVKEPVIEFLKECQKVWVMGDTQIENWIQRIQDGQRLKLRSLGEYSGTVDD